MGRATIRLSRDGTVGYLELALSPAQNCLGLVQRAAWAASPADLRLERIGTGWRGAEGCLELADDAAEERPGDAHDADAVHLRAAGNH